MEANPSEVPEGSGFLILVISVLVPAHNEERWIDGCLDSIDAAARNVEETVETVVCLNRCTDRTEAIARDRGAVIAREDARNLSKIRNAAARRASGDVLVTIDADSRMSPNMLMEVRRKLDTGEFIGGGVLKVKPERWSLGIVCCAALVAPFVFRHRITCGLFWVHSETFRKIGGFNEDLVSVEDVDFGIRLRREGKRHGKKYGHLWRSSLETSCRKFDWFGDWFLVRDPSLLWKAFSGIDQTVADRIWYQAERRSEEKQDREK